MRRVTIGVAGAGARAQQHMDTLALLPEHFRVVAVSDSRPERAQAGAARFGARAYADPLAMLDESRPEALFVVVPPDGHHPLTLAAARRGVHILCEVPISITLPLADLMIDACRRAGVVLEITENVPRFPKERIKREIVRQGLLGQILLARLQYTSGSYHGMSAVRRLLPGRAGRVWGFRRVLPTLPHRDLAGLLQDSQVWESGHYAFVAGGDAHGRGGEGGEAGEAATLLYELPPRGGGRNTWEIVGTLGRLTDTELHLSREAPDGRWRAVTYPFEYDTAPRPEGGDTLQRARVATDPPVVWENPVAGLGLPGGPDDVARASQLLTFHRSIAEGAPPEYGPLEARTDLELLVALRESARHGSAPVDLPLQGISDHERALHEEYRLTYGYDPLDAVDDPDRLAAALFPRGGITHGVTHQRIGEIT